MQKINYCTAAFLSAEMIDKINDYWFLFVFLVNLVIFLSSLIYDLIKSKKLSNAAKLEYVEELNKLGKDIKNYYDSRNQG